MVQVDHSVLTHRLGKAPWLLPSCGECGWSWYRPPRSGCVRTWVLAPLGRCRGVWRLRRAVRAFSVLWETVELPFKAAAPCRTRTRAERGLPVPAPSPASAVASAVGFSSFRQVRSAKSSFWFALSERHMTLSIFSYLICHLCIFFIGEASSQIFWPIFNYFSLSWEFFVYFEY